MTEETVRPEDLKPGDRVRVTFEGVLDEDGDLELPKGGCIARYVFRDATITRLPPPVDPDVLVLRAILHSHQRAMTPPDSGWGDMSYLKGSYDHLPAFQAALAAIKAAKEHG